MRVFLLSSCHGDGGFRVVFVVFVVASFSIGGKKTTTGQNGREKKKVAEKNRLSAKDQREIVLKGQLG